MAIENIKILCLSVCVLNPKELKTQHTNPDFGLIKQFSAFIRKFSSSQIQVGDYPSLNFIFIKFPK